MAVYTVYFEIGGKKMKKDVQTTSEEKAKEMVRQSISFHKVVKEKESGFGKVVDDLLKQFSK